MGRRKWRAWVGVIAVATGMATAGPVQAQQPQGNTAAATSAEVDEARRLVAEVNRLHAQGKYAQAIPVAQRLLALDEKVLGPHHPAVAMSLNNLAELYKENGDPTSAEPLLRRALAINETSRGADHPAVATVLNNLGMLYKNRGDVARAEPLLRRALTIREKAFGPNHAAVGESLNNLASLYMTKRDDARAELLYQRALAIVQKALGSDHPHVAFTLSNLALVYQDRGDYARAEPLYRRALAIKEKLLDPNHPDLAITLHNLALLCKQKKDDAQAEALAQRALTIWERAFGPSYPRIAPTLKILAELYNAKGEHARAGPLLRRALAIEEKSLGAEHADVARTMHDLGMLYLTTADYGRAEPVLQRALAVTEKTRGPNHPNVATLLGGLAMLYRSKGDYTRAELLYQRALSMMEDALGPNHQNVAAALNNLAVFYTEKADYARAEPLLQRSLAIEERVFGPNHQNVAVTLNSLGLLYSHMGEEKRAEPLYKRALAIAEKALGPDHPTVATFVNNLALLYVKAADYARAEPLLQRALASREKALGPEHPEVAMSLHSLTTLYKYRGEYGHAEALSQRALAIWEKVLGPNHPKVANALNNLAQVYQAKGDYGRAEPLYKRALAIREKALGPDHPDVALSLNNLALLHQSKRDDEASEALLARSLKLWEKTLGPDHPNIALSLSNLGMVYEAKGDHARAELFLQRSLAIFEKTLGLDHPNIALPLNNLALVYDAKGDHVRAEALFQRSRAIYEKALGPYHPDITVPFSNLAVLYVKQGRLKPALSSAQRATDVEDRNAGIILTTGSEEQKRLYMMNTLLDQTLLNVSLHVQHAPADPDAMRLALTTLLRRKARVLDAMTDSLAALRRSLARSDRELLDRLAAVYSQIAAEVSRGPGEASPEQYRKKLAALEHDRDTLEADVGRRSAALRAEQRLVSLRDVQSAIPEGAALVEIARYVPFQVSTGSLLPGEPRYVAYVLRRSGDPTFADLGEAALIEAAVDSLRRALADHDLTRDPKPAASALDRLLMRPIRKLLGDTRWVFVSADGPLHLVPFGALIDEQGHYLVERYLFAYLTTGRDLLRFGDKPAASREAPLVLAHPAFNDSGAPPAREATHRGVRSIDMVTQPLLPLGGTVEEANTIHSLFPDSRVLLGAQATEQAVKAARAPRLLHLATHGFFLPEQPVPEVLLRRTFSAEPTPAERAAILQRENPLLRSGIALAGFNRRRSGSDDGVLTALEVAGLDLHGTRLVVLSACETGVGEASSGEGVYGLRRALTIAGSQTQVMSLWQVDSGRTRELMQAYYQRLQRGAGRSEAMRRVQLAMLANPATAHPNLWASFIVSGDWRPLEGGRAAADLRVQPGPRGCACAFVGGEPQPLAGWLALALGLVAAAYRRSGWSRHGPPLRDCINDPPAAQRGTGRSCPPSGRRFQCDEERLRPPQSPDCTRANGTRPRA